MMAAKPLRPGDRVALVAPGSAVKPEDLTRALDFVRSLDLEPVAWPSCFWENRDGYLAACDARRAGDLMEAFSDPEIQGVWCIRGGYGSHRLLPLLEEGVFRRNPKWFGGYSDVTALHIYLNQVCGLETFHCIMPSTEPDADAYTRKELKKALEGTLSGIVPMPGGERPETLVPGQAEGILCGGNLSLAAASLGTPWEIDTRGKILFLEDIHEKTYRVDSMLTHLRNAGKFRDCAGILLGYWTDCPPEYPDRTLQLPEIFQQLIAPAGKPTLMALPCGHALPTMALPLGKPCRIDADKGTVAFL